MNEPAARLSKPLSTNVSEREPRGARRRRETRAKLLDAAFRLMAERGMNAVAINEITEAADVGFGSFYNHFESKEAIYAAVRETVFEDYGDALDRLAEHVEDPAEVIAICIRHAIMRARDEPLWGRFLLREGLSGRGLTHGLGARLSRDVQRGIDKGRFVAPDPFMSIIAVGAGVLGAISIELQFASPQSSEIEPFGFGADNIAERATTVLLTNLGVPLDEARDITKRALPSVA